MPSFQTCSCKGQKRKAKASAMGMDLDSKVSKNYQMRLLSSPATQPACPHSKDSLASWNENKKTLNPIAICLITLTKTSSKKCSSSSRLIVRRRLQWIHSTWRTQQSTLMMPRPSLQLCLMSCLRVSTSNDFKGLEVLLRSSQSGAF